MSKTERIKEILEIILNNAVPLPSGDYAVHGEYIREGVRVLTSKGG